METMTSNTTEEANHENSLSGILSYILTVIQVSFAGVLILAGIAWFAYTADLWADPRYSMSRSVEYIPYLVGSLVIVYLLGYVNNRWIME